MYLFIKLLIRDQFVNHVTCLQLMERLDPEMRQLCSRIRSADVAEEERKALEIKVKKREETLAPMYHQVRKT